MPSPSGLIAMVAKKFGVSHDTMPYYLSQWKVADYFGWKKT